MTAVKPITRSENEVWLIGPTSDQLIGKKLPTSKQVLKLFFHLHKNEGNNVKESVKMTILQVLPFWQISRIPTKSELHAREKLEKMFLKWKGLQKHALRRSDTQIRKENEFLIETDKLFDIAHADALSLIEIEEDKDFLMDQRGKRIGYIGSLDKKLAEKEGRVLKRKVSACKYEKKCKEKDNQSTQSSTSSNSDNVPSSGSENEDIENLASTSMKETPKVKYKAKNIITPSLAKALDRAKVSDRYAVHLIAATANSLGHDIEELALNRTTIQEARKIARAQESDERYKNIVTDPSVPIVVHWDGKLLPDTAGGKDVYDRLPILVSYGDENKLLGVPKLTSSPGRLV